MISPKPFPVSQDQRNKQRLPKRKYMTLISAFRGQTGIALCADSQETITYYDPHGIPYDLRQAVQKLTPIVEGGFRLVIAGSGNSTLIEAFIVRARRRLQNENLPNPAITDVVRIIEDELSLFYRNDVTLCQDDDKGMKLFIAASCPTVWQFNVWVTEGVVLREIASDKPELVGWEHEMYSEMAQRMYTPNMQLAQAVLASIYTLTVAKQTSNYVGGDLSVAVVRANGIWLEDRDYVESMEVRLRSYDAIINQLFLACADTEISPKALEKKLAEFQEQAQGLHRQQLDAAIQRMQRANGGLIMAVNPMARIPPGTMITVGANGQISNVDYDPPPPVPMTHEQIEVVIKATKEHQAALEKNASPKDKGE
jgi:hypothetical protein